MRGIMGFPYTLKKLWQHGRQGQKGHGAFMFLMSLLSFLSLSSFSHSFLRTHEFPAHNICFVVAHPNPASHFAEFVKVYEERGIACTVIADQAVSLLFAGLVSQVVEVDITQANVMGKMEAVLDSQTLLVMDVANEKWREIHQQLAEKYPAIKRVLYYDNPAGFVPGEYSKLVETIAPFVQGILFANPSLIEKGIHNDEGKLIDLSKKLQIGIGYYPKSDAEKVLEIRKNEEAVSSIKHSFLERNGIPPKNQKVFVYAGGANSVYYQQAFPHFVGLLSKLCRQFDSSLKDTIFVLQQHPRAKSEGNIDANLVREAFPADQLAEGFSFIISDLSMPEALAIADGVFYYQTSMAAQFVFAGIPVVAQVGHDTYTDALVKGGFPSVKDEKQLAQVLSDGKQEADIETLKQEVGDDSNWKANLLKLFQL